MDKLDMFQAIFGKVDEFGWWDLERIKTDYGSKLTSNDFQEGLFVCGVWFILSAPDYKEMNNQVEVTCITLQTIGHSIMVHIWVSDEHINFALI